MFPTTLAVVFTVGFVATGAYAFTRYVQLSAPGGGTHGTARAAELLHLLMSIAMVAMAWGWSGGPATGSGVVQLAVFGVFTAVFVVLATRARAAVAAISCSAHALMAVAMVWMVAAMPVLMGHGAGEGTGAGEHAGHAGHGAGGSAGGMDMSAMAAPAPAWAVVLNALLVVLLVTSAVHWVVRAARAAADAPAPASAGEPGADPARDRGSVATLAPAPDAARPTTARRARVLAASCHTLMSVGMAAMLLAMA